MCRHLTWELIPRSRNEGQGRKESQCGHVLLIWPWLQATGVASAGPRKPHEMHLRSIHPWHKEGKHFSIGSYPPWVKVTS